MENDPNCIFCSIANKTANATILYESDNVIIIQDIMPKAPVHVQVMPKRHIQSVNELTPADGVLLAEMFFAAKDYTVKAGIDKSGFKMVFNTGKEGGQIIQHLHVHLLGGKQLEE